jgi:hypothetical protein
MFKVTVDLFSGRPNPSWIVGDSNGEELLKKFESERQIISKSTGGYDGLGFRGINIELLGDEKIGRLPSSFKIANGLAEDQKTSILLARTLIDQMERYEKNSMDVYQITPVNREIKKIIMGSIDQYEKDIDIIKKHIELRPKKVRRLPIRVTVTDKECENCRYEESRFNPDFWNVDPNVRSNNNCYNYARNWKTNTFAQPGRFSGQTAGAMSCAQVSAAAMRDGLVQRCNCLPDSEYPRRLMALVIAPGVDYHWYRKQEYGFWGHKPGGTQARNYDNSNVLITDPRTADRGAGTSLNYTDFCGFFYAGKSVMIR